MAALSSRGRSAASEAPGTQHRRSPPRRRRSSADLLPTSTSSGGGGGGLHNVQSRLFNTTASREAYLADLSAKRGAAAASLISGLASHWRPTTPPPPSITGSGSATAGSGSGSPSVRRPSSALARHGSGAARPSPPLHSGAMSAWGDDDVAESSGRDGNQSRGTVPLPTLNIAFSPRSTERPKSAPLRRPQPRRSSLVMSSTVMELNPDALMALRGTSAYPSPPVSGATASAAAAAGGIGEVHPHPHHQVVRRRGPAGFSMSVVTTARAGTATAQPAFHFGLEERS